MADLYSSTLAGGSGTVGANAKKLLGSGASGVGPYNLFGNPTLQALKVVSATINFTTTPAAADSNLAKAVSGVQGAAEIYYIGKPTASGANQFIVLVNANTVNAGNANANDASYEDLEDLVGAALGVAEDDITITAVELTGLTFA